jgi:uncharacterized delta-60 repeat protein
MPGFYRPAVIAVDGVGMLDATFGDMGLFAALPTGYDHGSGGVVLPDSGEYFVTTLLSSDEPGLTQTGGLARLRFDGQLDDTFATSGWFLPEPGGPIDSYWQLVRQSEERIVAGRKTSAGFILEAWSGESYDTTFGVGGLATFPGLTQSRLAVGPAGEIVIARSLQNPPGSPHNILLRRALYDGTYDSAFEPAFVDVPGPYENTLMLAIAMQADGAILVAGSLNGQGWISEFGSESSYAFLARLTPSGELDPTFADGGVYLGTTIGQHFHAVALQPDGKIVVVGEEGNDGFVARFE